jgi:putative peptide zinc metalloprotease protein
MDKPLGSIDRPLELRLRPDLVAVPIEMAGAPTWVVKDPLTLEHFQFSAQEYAILDWLRRHVTIGELQRSFNRKFAPQTITPEAIWNFLSRLHLSGLLISDASGQGQELLARQRRENLRRRAASWLSILAIRFRGFDPDRFLTFLHEEFRWLFSPAALLCSVLLALYAIGLVVGHFGEFRARLPELSALVDARNLPWLLLAIGGVKVLHEFGHALTCKHYGGQVHEMGFMLLVFAPCLYCDVSDAWSFPNKWRRIAVSAAGMTVELVLAAAATIIWWHAQPGILQLIALNVMIVGSVNTLLVNGNPLLRYDGYYILSDLVETPNLWQRSRDALARFWATWLLGEPATGDPLVPDSRYKWLALYGAISKVYLAVVCVAIVWGLVEWLHPQHLQNLAYLVGFTVLASSLLGPLTGAVQIARNPIRRAELRKGRLALVMSLALSAIIVLLAVPVNYRVSAPLVLLPHDAARVFATTEGTLASVLPANRKVTKGETIGQLKNTETEIELARLEGEQRLRKLRVEHLEKLRGVDREANDQLPTARAALADSERRLAERRSDIKRLTLVAPTDGVIIPAPRTISRVGTTHATQLPTWSDSLLETTSTGAFVEPGTLVCMIGDPGRLSAVLLVNDTDVKRLQPGQTARLRIEQLPGQIIEGRIVEVSRHDVRETDDAKAARASLAPLMAGIIPPGQSRAIYEARVELDMRPLPLGEGRGEGALISSSLPAPSSTLIIGGRGEAKVLTERITLARRIMRYLAQTFRLPM